MEIKILCVGKLKERYLREAADEYIKRLSPYARLTVVEAADEKTPDSPTERQSELIKDTEGARILKSVRDDDCVIALAIDGKEYSSEAFSELIEKKAAEGKGRIAFVIGGSLGLSEAVLKRADLKLSFSAFTFPHQLMRVILLEQIYRAFRIMRGEPYHK